MLPALVAPGAPELGKPVDRLVPDIVEDEWARSPVGLPVTDPEDPFDIVPPAAEDGLPNVLEFEPPDGPLTEAVGLTVTDPEDPFDIVPPAAEDGPPIVLEFEPPEGPLTVAVGLPGA